MKIKYTDEKQNWISITNDDDSVTTSCYPPVVTFAKDKVERFLADGGTIESAFTRDDLYTLRYTEVTEKTSTLIDAPGYVFRSVPFHTDIVAQMNFSGLFAVRAGLTYPYTVWDGDGSIELADEADLTAFCMGVMAHIETARRTGKAVRDSLKSMTLEELLAFVDPRGQ